LVFPDPDPGFQKLAAQDQGAPSEWDRVQVGNTAQSKRQACFRPAVIVLDSIGEIFDNVKNMKNKGEEQSNKKLHKVIGAGIGWIVAGPVGAALGLLVGHTVENNPDLLKNGLLGDGLKSQYDILQVPYDAEPDQIKSAYKRLAQKYHPDRFVDADPVVEELAREKMSQINDAHGAIMEAIKKKG
jgi:DnaJ-domain-containing protein 1